MIKIRVEKYSDCRDELIPLVGRQWQEMPFDAGIGLSPDEPTYRALDEAGKLILLIARDQNRLVGYFVAFVSRHPHYDMLTAAMDIYYLLPEFRSALNGIRLFNSLEVEAKARGVEFLLATARLDRSPAASMIFNRLGWTEARTVFQKRLR